MSYIKVKHIVKPYGSDVIKIHRLLKNKITLNEYILFTNAVHELYATKIDRSWMPLSGLYDDQREDYFYKNLGQVREAVVLEAALS